MTPDAAGTIVLGTGSLNWPPEERKSDRYGLVCLLDPSDEPIPLAEAPGLAGSRGRLLARVVDSCPSYHVGDVFRGIFPPKVPLALGAERVLGQGALFFERGPESGHAAAVGLKPGDGRRSDWLDPEVLYGLHNSGVDLVFVPDGA